jgi:hypothetical protein
MLDLFRRNATVILRSNVRIIERTSGSDCHFPLPFYIAQAFRFTKRHKAA